MPKARSRLATNSLPAEVAAHRRSHPSLATRYLKHSKTLALSLPWFVGLAYVVTQVPPQQLANWPAFQGYGLFHLLLFGGNFFLFSFLLLKTRRGFLVSLCLQLLMFLKLQQVVLSPLAIGGVLCLTIVPLLLLELTMRFFDRK